MGKVKRFLMSLVSIILVVTLMFSLTTSVAAQTISADISEQSLSNEAAVDETEAASGNIIGEDETKRDEYTKHFVTDTGAIIAAQYGVPVHYKNEDGEYVDFDNSLVDSQGVIAESTSDEASSDEISAFSLQETEVKEDTFTNKKSNSKVSHFKKSGKAKLVEIDKDGHKISWGYSGANIVTAKEKKKSAEELTGNDAYLTLTNLSSKVVYENIYNNID